MEIDVSIVTYNGGGGHPVVSFVGDFLLLDAERGFGSAIARVDLYPRAKNSGPPAKSLGDMADEFEAHLKELPLIWFKRKSRLVEIAYQTHIASAEELMSQRAKPPSLRLFHAACREVVSVLALIAKRIKRSDDFDLARLDIHLQARLNQMPQTAKELLGVLEMLRAKEEAERAARNKAREAKRAARDDAPKLIAIDPDDYHAKHVGHTTDGLQFFLTTPFEPASDRSNGSEFVALYRFDKKGKLIEARIENFGPRSSVDDAKRRAIHDRWLKDLGPIRSRRIRVAPFAIERFGTTFGLVTRQPDDEGDPWAVEMQPGNYMAFFEPWDSGDYDT
jgi:hypothetical protein